LSNLTSVGRLRRDPLQFLSALTDETPLARRVIGRRTVVVAIAPEAAREALVARQRELVKENVVDARRYRGVAWKTGLLASNKVEDHAEGRRLLRPSFSREQTRLQVEPIVREASERFVAAWSRQDDVEVEPQLAALTMQVAARALFGESIPDEDAAVQDMRTVLSEFNLVTSWTTVLRNVLRVRSGLRFEEAWTRLAERAGYLATGTGPVAEVLRGSRLEPGEVAAEVRNILLAATETTSTALTWSLVELARNPALGAAVAEQGEPMAERVFAETLRLYPPAWFIGRLAVADTELAGELVKEGSMVLVSPYLLHRDARHFDDPTVFDPERWRDGTAAAARAFTFLPFGAGPRRCIGEEIAWLEARAILVTLARAFEFELVGAPDLTPFPGASLRPTGQVRMRLRGRAPRHGQRL
jgi:cytochrome P450